MKTEKKQLTEKQQAFLEALMGEAKGKVRKAMEIAGYSAGTPTYSVTNPLKDEIIDRANAMLAMNAPKAAHGLIEVLDDPTALGARNAINAAREVLDRTGLVKKEKVEVTSNGGGMFILPPKADDVEQ